MSEGEAAFFIIVMGIATASTTWTLLLWRKDRNRATEEGER